AGSRCFSAALRIAGANGVDFRACRSMWTPTNSQVAAINLAGFGVAHFMQEADRLVADFQEPAPDLDNIAGQQLALVGDLLLHGGHAAASARAWRTDSSSPRRTYRHTT